MKKFIQIALIRVMLTVGGFAFFWVLAYFLLGYVLYVVTQSDAMDTGQGFKNSIWAIAFAGAVISNIWFGSLGGDD